MPETEPRFISSAPSLEGKVALVTGAAGGIGSAIVLVFRAAGARVLALDIKADALAQAFSQTDDGVKALCCDATREDDVQRAVAAAVAMLGRVDVLVNGAACDEPSGTIVELSPAAWDQTFAANVRSAFLMSRAVVPLMARSGGGSIIHIASQLGRVGTAKRPAYCATKGALIQLAKAMAIDHAADRIRVNALSPGAVATGRLARRYGDLRAASAALGGLHLLGRLAEAKEIAYAALFLASDQASFVTGSDFLVDGGYAAR
ncbi:MAG TPA: SDR family oxidoreductase [Xanthobacteraceae bacterium]|jgi:NAD(P)-dependent dehydrogenase (short-subunit alcohol dehydrogenase family)